MAVTEMEPEGLSYTNGDLTEELRAHYSHARQRARNRAITTTLTRRENRLMSLHDIEGRMPVQGEHYRGLMQVPVRKIVGSMARYSDFDHDFNPLRENTRERWIRVAQAYMEGKTLPPVELLKVGSAYIVRDGNHRVSVAHYFNVEFIDAIVTEMDTPGSLLETYCQESLLSWESLRGAAQRGLRVLKRA